MTTPIPATPVPTDAGRLVWEQLVPAGTARLVRAATGQRLQVIDVRGHQVADMMAWRVDAPNEYLSPAHTISCLGRLVPRVADTFYSNSRRPLLRVTRDTVGRHDLLVPCCDPERYQRDFGLTDHGSCLASIRRALKEGRVTWEPRGELAVNLFMNNVIGGDGVLETLVPPNAPGDFIEFEVLDELNVVVSSCPQDLTACNGWEVTDIGLRLFDK